MIHMWWHESPPEWVIESHKAWQEITDLEVKLWIGTNDIANATEIASSANVVPQDTIRHQASVIRWLLLREHGGMWVDCDTHPLLDPSPLNFDEPFIASLRKNSIVPCVVGGPKEADIWNAILSRIPGRRGKSFEISGSSLVNSLGLDWWRIEPPGRFLDKDGFGFDIPLPPDGIRYCTHDWMTSAQRLKEGRRM